MPEHLRFFREDHRDEIMVPGAASAWSGWRQRCEGLAHRNHRAGVAARREHAVNIHLFRSSRRTT